MHNARNGTIAHAGSIRESLPLGQSLGPTHEGQVKDLC